MTGERQSELNWLAQQYVLGELTDAAASAFEARLADDEEACAALAEATQLVAALRSTTRPAPVIRPMSRGWRRVALGLAATAAAGAAIWLLPRTASEPPHDVAAVGPQRAFELVSRWRESLPEPAPVAERWTDDDADVADEVPNWLLAAVSLEADGAVAAPVQEN